jgi:hypothetical protein
MFEVFCPPPVMDLDVGTRKYKIGKTLENVIKATNENRRHVHPSKSPAMFGMSIGLGFP